MKSTFVRTVGALALAATVTGTARADAPDLSGFALLPEFVAGANSTSFTVNFLYGKAGNNNSLYYMVEGSGIWTRIMYITGAAPAETPDGNVSPLSVTTGLTPVGFDREIIFALCQGNSVDIGSCGPNGPFSSGVGATNLVAGTAVQWNAIGVGRSAAAGTTVFGFEDLLAGQPFYDGDFNDLVFSTSLTSRSSVPEPASLALLGFGFVGLVGAGFRRRSSQAV